MVERRRWGRTGAGRDSRGHRGRRGADPHARAGDAHAAGAEPHPQPPPGLTDYWEVLGLSAEVNRRIGHSLDLTATLEAVAAAVVDSLGFEVAVVNLTTPTGDLEAVCVSGPEDVRHALLGSRVPAEVWDRVLASAERWGRLRFLDHRSGAIDPQRLRWVPDLPETEEPDRWHPHDALFAPLTSPAGEMVGMLSVDDPADGTLPGPRQRLLIELFAEQAAIAIDNARVHSQLAHSEQLFRGVFAQSPLPIALLDERMGLLRVNPAFCRFTGRAEAELVGADAMAFTHPDDVADCREAWRRASAGEPVGAVEKRTVRPDGEVAWGRLTLTRLQTDGGRLEVLAQIEDVTERKGYEAQLLHDARHDPLTGLANRAAVLDRLARALERGHGGTAVLFCDVDRFKLVNDVHGHAVGDELLAVIARRLRAAVRGGEVVGRFGGDEFVVVSEHIRGPGDAEALAGRIVEAVRTPVLAAGVEVTPSISVGIALDDGATGAEQLIAHADSALYAAKGHQRGGWSLYTASMWREARTELHLREQLSGALDRDELTVHYQPIVSVHGQHLAGFEALLRWEHPGLGTLEPAEFLPLVLDTELEAPITDQVLDRACRDLARSPFADAYVSVNVTPEQLTRPDLPRLLRRLLAEHRLPGERLVLELTEDRLLTEGRRSRELDRLRELGVRIAIDDFGTGWAGLAYLRRANADIVKIDRSFISRLPDDPASARIVASVAELSTSLGLQVVAEGVETAAQLRALRGTRVGYAQGFHFGRPEPDRLAEFQLAHSA